MNNLLTTVCGCGHRMCAEDIKTPIIKCGDPKFYGGRVTAFSDTECPECGKEYKLYIAPSNQTWDVIDMEKRGEEKKGKRVK